MQQAARNRADAVARRRRRAQKSEPHMHDGPAATLLLGNTPAEHARQLSSHGARRRRLELLSSSSCLLVAFEASSAAGQMVAVVVSFLPSLSIAIIDNRCPFDEQALLHKGALLAPSPEPLMIY